MKIDRSKRFNACFFVPGASSLMFVFFEIDPASVDLEQMDLQMLCDGLRKYLQDLPQPVVPSVVYSEMIRIAQGGFP